ncbi:MAG: hypothetical protein RMM98_11960 [Acidobacteriota bacterium]|nr:DUF4351 domain-containing protein [Blastocatellia bacterium]MDW8240324.1 hypothetical protein [Acidobacteriota bacterium]
MWIEEGMQQGMIQGLRNALLAHIRERFSDVPAAVETRIRQINDVERLNQLLLDVDEFSDAEELERQLN